MRSFCAFSVLTILTVIGCPPLSADEGQSPPGPTLGLRAAIGEALKHSPQLSTSEDSVTTAEVQRRVALSRYRPAVTPTLNAGTAPSGLAQQSLGVTVSQLPPTGTQLEDVRRAVGARPVKVVAQFTLEAGCCASRAA